MHNLIITYSKEILIKMLHLFLNPTYNLNEVVFKISNILLVTLKILHVPTIVDMVKWHIEYFLKIIFFQCYLNCLFHRNLELLKFS